MLSISQDARPFELFVRDALRLEVDEPTAPPPLDPAAPDHRDLLTAAERARAAEQWQAWWRAALAHEARYHGARVTGVPLAWHREQAAEREAALGSPPDFAALSGSPELQRACTLLHPELRSWSRREPPHESPVTALQSQDCGDVAAEVAGRWGAELRHVHGVVLAYGVAGPWRRLAAPGVLVSSIVDLETEPEAVVTEVLESSVRPA
ncbi:hypothetical protein SAMN05216184_101820 [Georgenia satyanarayanai]|uniref:Uncharacterized protein n=2 Tax=Georgenia satyanarayanai TaxID=860221 RepID=A0A2Y8ZYN8_9MICO|nr:hypothetical protein A8987_101820 [Georgenia satyanarayanai]SSA37224.1 hypothetical protein SAMN05216184_101820 [Georgenia satyanarayanai]